MFGEWAGKTVVAKSQKHKDAKQSLCAFARHISVELISLIASVKRVNLMTVLTVKQIASFALGCLAALITLTSFSQKNVDPKEIRIKCNGLETPSWAFYPCRNLRSRWD
jgi:hypothetical protein